MTVDRIRLSLLIAVSALLAGVFGCPELQPAESVLAGTWELNQSANANVTDWLLTFDSQGDLTQMSYVVDNVLIIWTDPPAAVRVDGDQVHISATQSGNGLNFDGTLDSTEAPTTATGSLSADLVIGDLRVSVPQGPATLVKQ